jgi:hypothetical protein
MCLGPFKKQALLISSPKRLGMENGVNYPFQRNKMHGISMSEQIFAIVTYWQIFASKYLFISEYSQNFRRISRSSKYSLKNICIQANIHSQLFAQKRIFATYCFKLPFTSLRPQLISGSFWKYLLRKEYSICFYSFCM